MVISKTSAVLMSTHAVSPEFTTGAAGATATAALWAQVLVAAVSPTPAMRPVSLNLLLLLFMTFFSYLKRLISGTGLLLTLNVLRTIAMNKA
jgi:hypothetical protein